MGVVRTAEVLGDVSDSEVLVIFVTLHGEDPARIISEGHKIV
jgi:hypothetical protein